MELPKFRVVDGVKYYDIVKDGHGISIDGVIIGKRGKPIHQAFRNNNNTVAIDSKQVLVYKLILEVFYGKKDKDIGDYVLCFKDDDRTITTVDTVIPMTIKDFAEQIRPGIRYKKYEYNATKYILFHSGEVYNIKLNKFLTLKQGITPRYGFSSKTLDVKNLLIDHFGTTEMRNHNRQYKLVGGISFDHIKSVSLDSRSEEAEIDDIAMDVSITKYNCKSCKLSFRASSIKQVIKLGKQCIPCTKFINNHEGDIVILPHITSESMGRNKYTCKRCLAGYINPVDVCSKCDCLDIVKNNIRGK